MSIFGLIILGAVAGFLAKLLLSKSKEPRGFFGTILTGIAGAFAFTYIGEMLGLYTEGEFAGWIGATVGAVLVSLVWAAVTRR
ncbi:GlsB/YeaQ/YmgE family stress response membrane protein [uncultured Algimonas sp.]|uniref:GlsB/YeaQ/YmgE family stress response membrane protein n=1 Tax=uncultured Algimonas sp. TaxID=1547920 RepID=UPI002612968B|nr:GlsB/YeaQ/YmgE family stress response membrane protein [uncultured Algimonas sp.]